MAVKSEDKVPQNQERIHLALLQEALAGIRDVRDGRVETARQVLAKYEVRQTLRR